MTDTSLPDSWYVQGDDVPEPDPPVNRRDNKRFWLPPGEEEVVCFVDDVPFRIWEHNIKVAGRWGNFCTCVNGLGEGYDPCPGCFWYPRNEKRNNVSRYRVGFVTIISEAEFEYKGETYKNLVRLLPMKGLMLKKFLKYKDRKGSLVGARFNLWRTSETSSNIGDDWSFLDTVEGITEDTPEEEARRIISNHYDLTDSEGVSYVVTPYDYKEIFRPEKRDQILMRLGMPDPTKRGNASTSETTESSAPGAAVGQKIEL